MVSGNVGVKVSIKHEGGEGEVLCLLLLYTEGSLADVAILKKSIGSEYEEFLQMVRINDDITELKLLMFDSFDSITPLINNLALERSTP